LSLLQDSHLLTSLPAINLQAGALGINFQPAASLTMALLAPASSHLGTFNPRREYNPWASSFDTFDTQLSFEDSRQPQQGNMDALFKLGGHQGANSRLGNLQFSSSGHGLQLPQHSAGPFANKLQSGLCNADSFGTTDSLMSQQAWDDRNSSPYRGSLISSFRTQQDLRDSSASSSPFGSYSGSPRVLDFRNKRHSGSATGVSSPRTPPHGAGGHRIGIDPRLVVGSPLEIAWEVLHQNPGLAALLNLQPSTAKLNNLSVQEDDEPEVPADSATSAREPDAPLNPEQLTHEQGLVRSCRGLPARVRDDLIKAARLAVTRRDSSGRELPGTGLLPFFWRVQSNLKWLLQQPATLKGQLVPGQIDFITEEQRGLSFQKTVQQRVRLGELAVMLHTMLRPPPEPSSAGTAETGSSA
jgi:hypothetical protein